MNKIITVASVLLLASTLNLRAADPVVGLTSPSPQTVAVGTSVSVSGWASDSDGNLFDHWLEVRRPAGDWSWEGWLTSEPFGPALWGSGVYSLKSGNVTLTDVGTYTFRTTASDDSANYIISNEVQVTVTPPPQGHINLPTTISADGWTVNFSINDNAVVSGSKTYANRTEGDYSVLYTAKERGAGPGYVIWYEVEAFNNSQYPNLSYINHNQMLARYIRSTRSWVITKVGSLRTGWQTTWMYGYQSPITLSLTQFSFKTNYNTNFPPYNPHEDVHVYSIPTQTL